VFWSQYFIPTSKETPVGTEAISHQLLLRAGMVDMLTSGVYSYLPLGLRVLKNIERVIREEMDSVNARELFMPCLQPLDIWKKTGRDETLKDVMIKFNDNRGRELCLGPTHEEVITEITKRYIQSYRQLPVTLYQIQTKFRDEIRTRFGIVRASEFIMKDAYSFDRNEEGLKKNYDLMYQAYKRIFARCELEMVIIAADSGAMGGSVSHEFLVPAPIGEDEIVRCNTCTFAGSPNDTDLNEGKSCPQCTKGILKKEVAIELGHVFQLGTKYSQAQEALFLDEDGKQKPFIMGCYGIGVSRLIAAVIEKHHDEKGIIWPREIAPFDVELLALQVQDESIVSIMRGFYEALQARGISVLVDDRDESAGRKFNDADLIGIPYRVILSQKNLKQGQCEIKDRRTGQTNIVAQDKAMDHLIKLLKG